MYRGMYELGNDRLDIALCFVLAVQTRLIIASKRRLLFKFLFTRLDALFVVSL